MEKSAVEQQKEEALLRASGIQLGLNEDHHWCIREISRDRAKKRLNLIARRQYACFGINSLRLD
jgi:hypothetical protein